MNALSTWEGLRAHYIERNVRSPYYIGETREEYEALIKLGDMGFLWAVKGGGPCGGNSIGVAQRCKEMSGAVPFYCPEDSPTTLCAEDPGEARLIAATHNRELVRLYLKLLGAAT